jgi:cytochrome c-type biogenesis protein CcmH
MIGLWIAAAVLAAGAGGLILGRARGGPARPAGDNPDLAAYRRALAEIDELADRDLLGGEERAATRAEVGRRLLRAAERPTPPSGRSPRPAILLLAAAAAPMLAAALYLVLGSPLAIDQPFRARLERWRAQPERASAAELAAALRAVAVERPNDPEPRRRLALLDLSLGDLDDAAHALRQAVRIAPTRADLLAMLGEVLVVKARGVVDPDAQAIFRRALIVDPASPTATYYLGRADIASGDIAGGLTLWRGLIAHLRPSDPRRGLLQAEADAVSRTGALPSLEATGPRADLSRAIAGMVDSLATRLAAHPDDPSGWVRLVRAYGVLGQSGKQAAALERARGLFAGRSDVLDELAAAARPRS